MGKGRSQESEVISNPVKYLLYSWGDGEMGGLNIEGHFSYQLASSGGTALTVISYQRTSEFSRRLEILS